MPNMQVSDSTQTEACTARATGHFLRHLQSKRMVSAGYNRDERNREAAQRSHSIHAAFKLPLPPRTARIQPDRPANEVDHD